MIRKTAVILVHYEDYAEKHFAECYQSLMRQSVPEGSFTIFIVDNGAKVDLGRAARRTDTRFVDLEENLGWAGGNNAAIRLALEENYEYIVLLNMDTTLDEDWLKELHDEALRRPDTHIFQSKILLHGTRKINSVGNRTHFLGYGYCHGYGREEANAPPVIDFASGAAMLVKSEVFRKIGHFREDYFMYYDDMEFCWRARLAGFGIALAEKSVCSHKYDFTSTMNHLYFLERNRLLTVLTLEKIPSLLLIAAPLVIAQILSGAYFTLKGRGKEEWWLFLFFTKKKTWRHIFETRRQIRALRVRRDADLVRNFSGKIVFAEIKNPVLKWFLNPLLWLYWKAVKHFIFW